MSRFWVDKVAGLKPYVPGEQPASVSLMKLNTNEHALPPSEAVLDAIRAIEGDELRRYPDPAAVKLRTVIASAESLSPEQVFVGNGSDEVLAHLWFAFLSGRPVQTLDTTYGFYPVWARLYGSELMEVPVQPDFSVGVEALKASADAIILANPNAPTGLALSRKEIEALVVAKQDRLVVIDEAYYGFGAESAAPLVHEYDNVIITRSLSKSHALAGLRVGYALAQPELIEGLNRVKDSFNSYPLDAIAQAAATAAIEDSKWLQQASAVVAESRQVMAEGLIELDFEVLPSLANFMFVRHHKFSGARLFEELRARGILVRRWDHARIAEWLRISVGTPAQADELLRGVREILQANAS